MRLGTTTGAVALGGAIGSTARYALELALPWNGHSVPWTTLAINVLGSGLLGLLLGLLPQAEQRLPRAFLGTGVLGGFTTFSTYAVQANMLVDRGEAGPVLGYLAGTLLAALAAAWAGGRMGRALSSRSVVRRA